MQQPPNQNASPSSSANQYAQRYHGGAKLLFTFWAIYLLTLWFLFISAVSPAIADSIAVFLLAECVGICIWDWSNVSTLYGSVRWGAMSLGERIIVGLLFAMLFFAVPGIYLLLATAYHFRAIGMSPRQLLRNWYTRFTARSGWVQAGVVVASIAAVIFFCSGTTAVLANTPTPPASSSASQSGSALALQSHATATPRSTATPQPTATLLPTATLQPTATPLPTATPKPTATPVRPTLTPKPVYPTPTPKPTCNFGGAPSNPWCYTFNYTGKFIYSPPSAFCNYFNCIPSFWTHTNGYVEECQDGTYSHSGGVSGSCSYHGGNLRPLYQP